MTNTRSIFHKRHSTILVLIVFIVCISFLGVTIYNINTDLPIEKDNLKKFYTITQQDALFYDPNTDEEFLKNTVLDLKEVDDHILSTENKYRKNAGKLYKDIYPSDWRLWPDDFLKLLPSIHHTTKNFLKNNSEDDAKALIDVYEQASVAYKKAIDNHIVFMQAIFKKNPAVKYKKIVFLGAATTPEIVYHDFLLIQKNAQRLQEEITERKNCLYHGLCSFTPSPSLQASKSSYSLPFDPLPGNILGVKRNESLTGPYWGTTGCFGLAENGETISYPFYIKVVKNKNNQVFLKPMMSNTKYYRDYRGETDPAAQVYLRRGISIRAHPEVNDYFCTDLRYIPDLFMQYLHDKKGISNKISFTSKIATLPYIIEHTISFSDFVYYYTEYRKQPFDPLYFLVNRSAYSLYFGTFSSSIWRIPQNPTFLLSEDFSRLLPQTGYIKYESLLQEGFTQEDFEKFTTEPRNSTVYTQELEGK